MPFLLLVLPWASGGTLELGLSDGIVCKTCLNDLQVEDQVGKCPCARTPLPALTYPHGIQGIAYHLKKDLKPWGLGALCVHGNKSLHIVLPGLSMFLNLVKGRSYNGPSLEHTAKARFVNACLLCLCSRCS